MPELRIAADLTLPIEFATEASAILARRGRGKTYTASVLAEELHAAGQPFVVLDPVGVWWGLRSSADGQSPGLDVKILGGEHSDVPLGEKDGTVLATFVVDHPAAYVIDLSGFEQKAPQDRFVADFAERLYRYKASMERRTPLTLIIDEADQFAPQKPSEKGGIGPRMLGSLESIVRQGRARGLGCVLITQRPAVLNKNVLTQAGALVLLGITGPQDRAAVDDWIVGHAEPTVRKEVIGSLARLNVGEAWVWWPTEDLLQRAQIRQRRTFDSSSTPKAGEKREVVQFADVDLDALKDALAEQIEKAKAEDPKHLQAQIRELRRELAEARAAQPEPEVQVERVEVPVLDSEAARAVHDVAMAMQAASEGAAAMADRLFEGCAMLKEALAQVSAAEHNRQAEAARSVRRAAAAPPARREPRPAPASRVEATGGYTKLGKADRAVLTVLAQYPEGKDRKKLGLFAGYRADTGHFGNVLGGLRQHGLIDHGDPIRITDAGMDALGDDWERLPTGPALLDWWLSKMPGPQAKVFTALVEAWPDGMTRAELGEATDYRPDTGHFGNLLGWLRSRDFVVGSGVLRVADDFMEAVGGDAG